MSRELIVRLTDDIDGGEATETVTFALRGAAYEIDLNLDHVADLEQALQPWIKHARPTDRPRVPTSPTRHLRPVPREDLRAMRSWARDNGYRVSTRGRVSTEIRQAFEAAHR